MGEAQRQEFSSERRAVNRPAGWEPRVGLGDVSVSDPPRGSALGAPFETDIHFLFRFVRSVVEGSEPLVQWNDAVGVVHFEMLVVQIVGEAMRVYGAAFRKNDFVESRVVGSWRKARVD